MAGKKRLGRQTTETRQRLAREKVLDYVRRLGLRKAARRLDARVSDVRTWLKEREFPKNKLEIAIGLGQPGGAFVKIAGTNLAALLQKHGKRKLAKLTGLSEKQIVESAGKRAARITFKRSALKAAAAKTGIGKLAEILDTKKTAVEGARQQPITQATLRLRKFAKHHGDDVTARYLGINKVLLAHWLRTNIPKSWEEDVNQTIGKWDAGPTTKTVRKKRGNIEKEIRTARKLTNTWNKKVPTRYRIRKADAERWARLGIFDARLTAAKTAYKVAKTPQKDTKPKPPPRRTPPRPVIPPKALPPPGPPPPKPPKLPPGYKRRVPKPPKKPPEIPPEAPEIAIAKKRKQDFLEARSEAFFEGRYPTPPIPWNATRKWSLNIKHGLHLFRKVQRFVHELHLDKMGTAIIKDAQKLWRQLEAGPSGFMTVKLTFSVMGDGHPFYPDAFIEGDKVNFKPRYIAAYTYDEIEPETRKIMEEVFHIDAEVTMLYFEHYEVIKSTPK